MSPMSHSLGCSRRLNRPFVRRVGAVPLRVLHESSGVERERERARERERERERDERVSLCDNHLNIIGDVEEDVVCL